MNFYSDLFHNNAHYFPSNLQGLIQSSITIDANMELSAIPYEAEILAALNSMYNSKSLGTDGMNPLFYNSFGVLLDKMYYMQFRTFSVVARSVEK